jgi:hypothetical protein
LEGKIGKDQGYIWKYRTCGGFWCKNIGCNVIWRRSKEVWRAKLEIWKGSGVYLEIQNMWRVFM